MSNLVSLVKRAPRRFSVLLAIVAAAIVVPATLFAWGPTRETFTIEKPASYVTFNSITNNPNIGDERNFVGIRESGTTNLWKDEMSVQNNKEYTVRMYVHNNAAANLNLVANDVTAKFNLPTTTGKEVQVNGFLSASNSKPGEVYDHAKFVSDRDFNVALVPGSIIYENNKGTHKLPESILTETGAKLGYDKMDGKIPGCFEFAGYVSFKVKAQVQQVTDFTLDKKVSKHGENKWVENYKAKPGEVVDFVLQYKNTGEVQHDSVTFRDTLPTGLSYVANSTKWGNARGTYDVTTNDGKLTNGTGINIGSYKPGAAAWTTFSAKVADESKLKCGANTLRNVGKVNTGGYAVENDATVTVDKTCEPPKPVAKFTCDSLSVTKLERTKFKFDTKYTVENATFKSVTYVVRDASGKELYRGTNSNYTQATAGKYSVQAIVTVTVDGKDLTATNANCKKEFEVVKPKTPAVSIDKKVDGVEHKKVNLNQEFDYQLVVKNTGEVDLTNVKVTDPAPEHVQFLSASVGTITNGVWNYTIPSLKIGESKSFTINAKATKEVEGKIVNTACVDAPQVPGTKDDCDDATVEVPPTPVIEVCDLESKTVITIKESDFDTAKHSKNLDDCKVTTTPPELPHTGAADGILGAISLGALAASVTYYAASRRLIGAN